MDAHTLSVDKVNIFYFIFILFFCIYDVSSMMTSRNYELRGQNSVTMIPMKNTKHHNLH